MCSAATTVVTSDRATTAAGKLLRIQHRARLAAPRSRLRRVRRQWLRYEGNVCDG